MLIVILIMAKAKASLGKKSSLPKIPAVFHKLYTNCYGIKKRIWIQQVNSTNICYSNFSNCYA